MTEQEAFDNPEMKTILLLSGYARELSEGADYETTTYKLAETLVKVFSISHVINCNPDQKAALKAAVDAIYFDDNSDYQTALHQVICSLTGLEDPDDKEIKKLFKELNPD